MQKIIEICLVFLLGSGIGAILGIKKVRKYQEEQDKKENRKVFFVFHNTHLT